MKLIFKILLLIITIFSIDSFESRRHTNFRKHKYNSIDNVKLPQGKMCRKKNQIGGEMKTCQDGLVCQFKVEPDFMPSGDARYCFPAGYVPLIARSKICWKPDAAWGPQKKCIEPFTCRSKSSSNCDTGEECFCYKKMNGISSTPKPVPNSTSVLPKLGPVSYVMKKVILRSYMDKENVKSI